MKRNLLVPLLFSQVLNVQAYAADQQPSALSLSQQIAADQTITPQQKQTWNDKLQAICDRFDWPSVQATNESNRVWREIADQINNARIDSNTHGTIKFGDHGGIEIGNRKISETSLGGKYSGVDKYYANLSLSHSLTDALDVGASANREITFIQQFPSRCKSLLRIGYDPISNNPVNAEKALTKLKPGDFVSFSAPMTLSIGKGIEKFINGSNHFPVTIGASYWVSGEMNIHIFRMSGNYVRVRLFSGTSTGVGLSYGFKVISFTDRIKVTPLEVSMSKSSSQMFSADYVFNLDKQDSRDLYNQLMGKKIQLKNALTVGVLPGVSKEALKDSFYADLSGVDEVAVQDGQVNLPERRILRLAKGDNATRSNGLSLGSKFFSFAKAKHETTYGDSDITQFNVLNEEKKYKIKSLTTQNDVKFFELYGQQDTHSTAFLLEADTEFKPLSAKGLQSVRVKEELAFSKDEVSNLKYRLDKTLPTGIASKISLPNESNVQFPIANARIEETLFLDASILEKTNTITFASVQNELKLLLKSWGKVKADPMNENYDVHTNGNKGTTEIDAARGRGEYEKAYDYELSYIPKQIENIFNSSAAMDDKLRAYDQLQHIELFNELGAALILRIIDKAGDGLLEKSVVYKLVITGRGVDAKITEFPASADLTKLNIFNRILSENSFLLDRTFNLRYYLNEKAEPLSLKEVVDKSL